MVLRCHNLPGACAILYTIYETQYDEDYPWNKALNRAVQVTFLGRKCGVGLVPAQVDKLTTLILEK